MRMHTDPTPNTQYPMEQLERDINHLRKIQDRLEATTAEATNEARNDAIDAAYLAIGEAMKSMEDLSKILEAETESNGGPQY
jgi:hypothetical protein